LVHVELTPGAAVAILPAWKLDAVYCARLKVGTPQVSLAALYSLRELLRRARRAQTSYPQPFRRCLAGFSGILQVDGYGAYAQLAQHGDVALAFC
jgi:hypothetical protein